jgi:hypothetical protein
MISVLTWPHGFMVVNSDTASLFINITYNNLMLGDKNGTSHHFSKVALLWNVFLKVWTHEVV